MHKNLSEFKRKEQLEIQRRHNEIEERKKEQLKLKKRLFEIDAQQNGFLDGYVSNSDDESYFDLKNMI